MPRKIILHLGLHKTATTALQSFFDRQARALAAAGAYYVPLKHMRSDVTPLLTSLDDGKRVRLALLVEGIDKRTVLLSDENILGSPGDITRGALYPFARNRLETFCDEHREAQITLFITLREPQAFLASLYCEYLRHKTFVSFADYVAGYDLEEFSYLEIFGWLMELPPEVTVRIIPFETARGGGVEMIARALVEAACGPEHGVDLAAFPTAKSRSAFSVEELGLAAEIAAQADPKTAQLFLNMLDARGRRFGTTRFAPLPEELAARLEARYDADLAAFAERRHAAA